MRLRQHAVTLRGAGVTLRPMTEGDWGFLSRWGSDPEVLWFSEGDDVQAYPLQDVQGIFREVSQTAFCFIIEVDGRAIGECWLQDMNIERILAEYPHEDCRRIDLTIGEKELWGQGYGTDTITTLTRFGFEQEGADMIFGCSVADYNSRSRRAYEKVGYTVHAWVQNPPGEKARRSCDLVLGREGWCDPSREELRRSQRSSGRLCL